METNGMLLSASNPSIEITNTDFMEHTSGDVNGNNGWDLW